MSAMHGAAPPSSAYSGSARRKLWHRISTSENAFGLAFVGPHILGLLIFSIGPLIIALYLSFCQGDFLSPFRWIGLQNYTRALRDELFWKSLANTAYYVVGTVPATLALALVLAIVMNQQLRGIVIFRAIFFLPTITSSVVVALVWQWMYAPSVGVISKLLEVFGLPEIPWLGSTEWSMPALIIMSVWRRMGYNMLLYLAGLQTIPKELYEAAEIDGAGRWDSFRHVTFPLLTPTTFMLLILSIISAFQVFEYSYIMTGGGPLYSTLTIVLHIYNLGFVNFDVGYAAAVSFFLFLIVLVLTVIQLKGQNRWVNYDLQ